jgi:hypothetical protein
MTRDTLTLALNGDISLADFSKAIQQFFNLLCALHDDVAKESSIEWLVENLEAGSAIATIRGIGQEESDEQAIEHVIEAYLDVGYSIQRETTPNYSKPVQTAAKKLTSLINGRIKSVRFETPERDVEIFSSPQMESIPIAKWPDGSLGAVRGRVQSMSNRGQLRFTLYDLVDDRAISCYLLPGSETIMRQAWGKVAMVEGYVRRDPVSGYPTTVRGVKEIRIVHEGRPGDYRQAIGAAPGFLGDTLPEEVIRRARDA